MLQLSNREANGRIPPSGLQTWKLGDASWNECKRSVSRTIDFEILVRQRSNLADPRFNEKRASNRDEMSPVERPLPAVRKINCHVEREN